MNKTAIQFTEVKRANQTKLNMEKAEKSVETEKEVESVLGNSENNEETERKEENKESEVVKDEKKEESAAVANVKKEEKKSKKREVSLKLLIDFWLKIKFKRKKDTMIVNQ